MKLVNLLAMEHVEFTWTVFLGELEKLIDQIGKRTIGVHLPFYGEGDWDLSSKHTNEQFEQFIRRFEKYKKQLRVRWLVVHPPEDPKPDWDLFFERLKPFGRENIVLLENIPTHGFSVFTEIYRNAKKRLGDQLGFCFDVAHSFLANERFLNLPPSLCTDLQYLHLTNTSSRETDDHLPLGTGIIPLDHVFKFLKRIRFDGVITLEVKPKNMMDALRVLDSYLHILRHLQLPKYLQTKARLVFVKPLLKKKLNQLKTV